MIMANFIKLGYTVYCIHFLPDTGVQVEKISKQKQEAEVWGTLLKLYSGWSFIIRTLIFQTLIQLHLVLCAQNTDIQHVMQVLNF